MYVGRLKSLLVPVLAVILIMLVLNMKGPANVLQQIEVHGNLLHLGQRDFAFVGTARTFNWMLNYTKYLVAAYSPTKGHVNPHNFKLVLDEPMACMDPKTETPKPVLLLVLVASIHRNFKRRQAIRETWGSLKQLAGLPIVTLFLLGDRGDPSLHKRVLEESLQHHDLLMEDFVDTYRNLTLKTMMAMKWASTHCPQASFVMKTDDDMFVSYQNLLDYVTVLDPPRIDLAFGLVIAGEAPIRDKGSKWYMPQDVFPGNLYPPWLSGGGFVLSGDVPGKIYAASLEARYLHLEDVFVGLCLEKLNVKPIMNRQFSNLHIKYSYCRFRYVITAHSYGPDQLRTMWKELLIQKPCWPWT
ncbi:beta-1,3-galactosyltransferase 1-like [Acanthaster planci]|uniref:Hexosyltransferase n=1 Tax=Acanthaster planci TaxID=133434 RepID=A0A8B8A4N0_ACAPL|nr:beta-1,3-galactosyltransferase 1-like [Acanthaster planci]